MDARRQTSKVHVGEGGSAREQRGQFGIGETGLPDDAPADLLGGGRSGAGKVLGDAGSFGKEAVIDHAVDAAAFETGEGMIALGIEVEAVVFAEFGEVDERGEREEV